MHSVVFNSARWERNIEGRFCVFLGSDSRVGIKLTGFQMADKPEVNNLGFRQPPRVDMN